MTGCTCLWTPCGDHVHLTPDLACAVHGIDPDLLLFLVLVTHDGPFTRYYGWRQLVALNAIHRLETL